MGTTRMRGFAAIMAAGAAGVGGMLPASALGQVFHSEAVNGDLSNNGMTPTAYTLAAGARRLIASTGSGDRDYLAITIPAGHQLSQLQIVSYTGPDPVAFIGVMAGPQFTEPPVNANAANLMGYAHFGPGEVGTDILDDMSTGLGAQGFTPPLPAGTYSFWINQAGLMMTTEYDFVVESTCYADCNLSGTLTLADFGCFQGKYVLGDLYADCNASGGLSLADFGCFQSKYVLGCP
ncbi:MAG: hypothetical protein ACKVU4_12530 [Phycisphaerales bacterium]